MKATGIVRKIDELGRFVIPKELRTAIGVTDTDNKIEIFARDNEIVLKKYAENNCIFCGNQSGLIYFKDKYVCKKCASEISK